jgi:hypothetical protein
MKNMKFFEFQSFLHFGVVAKILKSKTLLQFFKKIVPWKLYVSILDNWNLLWMSHQNAKFESIIIIPSGVMNFQSRKLRKKSTLTHIHLTSFVAFNFFHSHLLLFCSKKTNTTFVAFNFFHSHLLLFCSKKTNTTLNGSIFFKHGRFFHYSSFSFKNEKNMAIRHTKTNLKNLMRK